MNTSIAPSDIATSVACGDKSPPISVVVLTYNEEVNIRQALESVTWCDNVLVVDSYSTDRTQEICTRYPNVTWVQHHFHDLASQRQFALDSGLIVHPWVLALDADEYVTPELRNELIAIAETYREGDPVAYDTAMRIIMWGKWLRFSSEYPVFWRRFFRRDRARYVQRGHADTVDVDGPIGRTKHDLIHHDHKGLSDWLAKHNKYTTQEAIYALDELSEVPYRYMLSRDRLVRRRALKRLFRSLPGNSFIRFVFLFIWKLGFLDGVRGYEFCRLRAQQHFVVHLKMREIAAQRADANTSQAALAGGNKTVD